MKVYEVSGAGYTEAHGTLGKAIADAKDRVRDQGADWRDVEILEADVPTSKENILRLINNIGGTHQFGRRWGFKTARLGIELLKEQQ